MGTCYASYRDKNGIQIDNQERSWKNLVAYLRHWGVRYVAAAM